MSAQSALSYERDTHEMGDLTNTETSYSSPHDSNQTAPPSKSHIPSEVEKDREDGTEEGCRQLARAFFERYGYKTLSKFTKRGELSQFYVDTFSTWSKGLEPRHFKQVLFALCVDGKVCRVVGKGRFIKWNNQNRRSGDRRRPRRQNRSNGGSNGEVTDELIAKITAAVVAAQNKSDN